MVELQDPFFPDVMEKVIDRVIERFANLDESENRISISFYKGLINQAGRDRMKAAKTDVFIWLPYPFDLDRQSEDYYADTISSLIIATETKADYTEQEREDLNFKPKLLPVYERTIFEIKNEEMFLNPRHVKHKPAIFPYWGGGDVGGPSQANLWKEFVDAIRLSNIKLPLDFNRTETPFTNL